MSNSKQIMNHTNDNPFFQPYGTPHNTTPFSHIKIEHFQPAIREGIRLEDEEIKRIIDNPKPATFQNTLLPLEHSGALLDRASTVMGNLLSANTCDELENIAQELVPEMTQHSNNIRLNPQLFARIKAVYDSKPELTDEEQTLLKKTYEAFERSGVGLPEDKKQELRALSESLSMKSLQFSQNVLKDTNEFELRITNEADLKGLTDHQKELAAQTAKDKKKSGWIFTLQAPSFGPFMTYAENRSLRRKMYMAHNTLCTHPNAQNNLELVKELVNLRLRYAQILGFKTFADCALERRMAENVETVNRFLNKLIRAYKGSARKEVEAIKDLAKELEGPDFKFQPWDFSYYSHKLQLKLHNLDSEMLRPYFELSNVKKGVFGLAEKLYGITFKRNKDIQVYHPDVEAYEVFDKDGTYLSVLYADFFPRESKKGGAWMTSYQGQYHDADGTNVRPHVSLTMNLTRPTANKPSLLTLGEVTTFLHEFGHGLHEMFSQCRFETLSGTNVYWDFVELPSQFMENFGIEKEFLRTFAFHYQTGEVIPDELIQRVIDSQTFNAAYGCLRQVSFGLLDMAYYTQENPIDEDIIQFEKRAWHRAILLPQRFKVCMSTQFQHIMTGGYAAGYYCYKWAEVLDADAFSLFKEKGIFNSEVAESFRRNILEKGATEHPKVLYKNFRKREPSIEALLIRDGIKSTKG